MRLEKAETFRNPDLQKEWLGGGGRQKGKIPSRRGQESQGSRGRHREEGGDLGGDQPGPAADKRRGGR